MIASGDGLKQGLVGSLNVFEIETKEITGDIEVRITGKFANNFTRDKIQV